MKTKTFLTVIFTVAVLAITLSSCQQRTCPTYTKLETSQAEPRA
jgi:hypothetical protein